MLLLISCETELENAEDIESPLAHTIALQSMYGTVEYTATLRYSTLNGDAATACEISNYKNLIPSSPCSCSMDGVCTVKVMPTPHFGEIASFDYTISIEDKISNIATASSSITKPYIPLARIISFGGFHNSAELILELKYLSQDSATTCAIDNLQNLVVSSECSCSKGICSVGITSNGEVYDRVSFDYTVSVEDRDSNVGAYSGTIWKSEFPVICNPGQTLSGGVCIDIENLLLNPEANKALTGWKTHNSYNGCTDVKTYSNNSYFVMKNLDGNSNCNIRQDVSISSNQAGKYALMFGMVSSDRVGDLTGLPYLYGYMMDAPNKILDYLQGQRLRSNAEIAGEWVQAWGIFQIPENTNNMRFFLTQAERKDVPANGSVARYDNLGLYILDSKKAAEVYLEHLKKLPLPETEILNCGPNQEIKSGICQDIPEPLCSVSLSSNSEGTILLSASGGTGVLTYHSCGEILEISNQSSWLHISSSTSGSGPFNEDINIYYTYEANQENLNRQDMISVGEKFIVFTQMTKPQPPCFVRLSSDSEGSMVLLSASGGSGILTYHSCGEEFQISNESSWLHISSSTSGTGQFNEDIEIQYYYELNQANEQRYSVLRIGEISSAMFIQEEEKRVCYSIVDGKRVLDGGPLKTLKECSAGLFSIENCTLYNFYSFNNSTNSHTTSLYWGEQLLGENVCIGSYGNWKP